MADPPPYPGTGDDSAREPVTRTPRWVYGLWIIGILAVVLFVALHLTGVLGPGGH